MHQMNRAMRMCPKSCEVGLEANSESAVMLQVSGKVPTLSAPVLLTPHSLPLNLEPRSSPAPEERLRDMSSTLHVLSTYRHTWGTTLTSGSLFPSLHLTCPHTVARQTLRLPREPHVTHLGPLGPSLACPAPYPCSPCCLAGGWLGLSVCLLLDGKQMWVCERSTARPTGFFMVSGRLSGGMLQTAPGGQVH